MPLPQRHTRDAKSTLLQELEELVQRETAKSLLATRKRLRGEPDEAPANAPPEPKPAEECEACEQGTCEDPAHLPDEHEFEE